MRRILIILSVLLALLPAFLFSALCIMVASLLTAPPSKEIEEDFEAARTSKVE